MKGFRLWLSFGCMILLLFCIINNLDPKYGFDVLLDRSTLVLKGFANNTAYFKEILKAIEAPRNVASSPNATVLLKRFLEMFRSWAFLPTTIIKLVINNVVLVFSCIDGIFAPVGSNAHIIGRP